MKNWIFAALAVVMLWGCDTHKDRIEEYCGTYEGTLPAADGSGIKTTVSLDKAHHFTAHLVYIDKTDGSFNEKGTFSRENNILTLKQTDDEVTYYRIEPGQLRQLNQDKEPVKGNLAEHYILKKVAGCK